MEITEFVEKNASLLRLGLHLEYNDARHRIANHLQRNIDRSKYLKYDTHTHTQLSKQNQHFFLSTDVSVYQFIFEISIVNFHISNNLVYYHFYDFLFLWLNYIHFNWRHRIRKEIINLKVFLFQKTKNCAKIKKINDIIATQNV